MRYFPAWFDELAPEKMHALCRFPATEPGNSIEVGRQLYRGIRMLRTVAALLVGTLLLAGCSKPLPESKRNYVGDWQSKEMRLLILADGTVAYKRSRNGATTSVNGPIKEFDNGDFVVGFLFITTTFEVMEAPHEADQKWQMVVDGVRLTRVE